MPVALRWLGIVMLGMAAGAAAALGLGRALTPDAPDVAALVTTLRGVNGLVLALVAGTPVLAAVVAALVAATGGATGEGGEAARARPAPAASAAVAGEEALTLLALLQQEGRFVDFVEEDLASYADAQIGAAVRSIHEGCRSVLRERLQISPVLEGEEGATVTVEAGFDPAAIRLTGNVRGQPPYQGVLRHAGWRSTVPRLPERAVAGDASILAPAEVEVL
jgi:hypothetical protein